MKFWYVCSECGRTYEIGPQVMTCPHHNQKANEPLRGLLEVDFDDEVAAKFRESLDIFDILPVEREFFPMIPVGNTPLWKPLRLNEFLGFENVFVKADFLNPTGSLKDRASFLVSAFANKFGIKEIIVASTGNAGSSMAGIGAAAGQKVTLFIPADAPRAKLIQALQYGAEVVRVDGTYDLAYDLSMKYAERKKCMSRNTAYNPMTIEGKKTVAIEIFMQLGKRIPDFVFVPVGDGVILSGVFKGFRDLMKVGLTDRMPHIVAVQSVGSNVICEALKTGRFVPKVPKTVADSIAVGVPRGGYLAVKKLRHFDGTCVEVSDDEILDAQKILSTTAGVFAEPAAAASLAGFIKMKSEIPKNAVVILLITGNGLKDIEAAAKKIQFPDRTIKTLEELLWAE